MKKFIYTFVLLAGVFLSGCENEGQDGPDPDMVWDFINWNVCFVARNAAGENLMDPQVAGNWLGRDIYAEYKGEVYSINTDATPVTRYNMPIWRGLRVAQAYSNQKPMLLLFGEFSPTGDRYGNDFKDETFTIHWGDGTSSEVKFDLYITWKKGEPTIHHKVWYDRMPQNIDCTLEWTSH